jgi:hypothetical protein
VWHPVNNQKVMHLKTRFLKVEDDACSQTAVHNYAAMLMFNP